MKNYFKKIRTSICKQLFILHVEYLMGASEEELSPKSDHGCTDIMVNNGAEASFFKNDCFQSFNFALNSQRVIIAYFICNPGYHGAY